MSQKKKILMVFDLPRPPHEEEDFRMLLKQHPDYRDEKDVWNALSRLGYEVELFGLYQDLTLLLHKLSQKNWHLVFVMCESFRNERNLSPHVVSVLEMMGSRYTGANSTNLQICRDKALTKKILQFHGIPVPKFSLIKSSSSVKCLQNFPFPAIVKPLDLEASEGITCRSVVASAEEAIKRAAFVENKWHTAVIIEEFIAGREFYVGVLGNRRIETFPPQELKFNNLSPSVPKIASYRVKWDLGYKKSHGIDSSKATALDAATRRRIDQLCKKIYKALELRGYARIDLRMTDEGKVYFIEANPNPAINRNDDFAASARHGGVSYTHLIDKIVKLGTAA